MGTATATVSALNATATQIGPNDPSGQVFGTLPTIPEGFFGATPIVQPPSQGALKGAVGVVTVYATTQSPTSVAPNTAAEQDVTVTGVATGQLVLVNKPTAQAGLLVGTARAKSTNTVSITFGNDTAATITPTATETYYVTAIPATLTSAAVLTPVAVGPNLTVEQQFAVTGVPAGAALAVNKPTAQAGLIILGSRVVSAGLIGITFQNLTAATITPTAAESYLVYAARELSIAPVMKTLTATLTPVSVAANTTAEQTFTVAGIAASTPIFVSKPSVTPGLGIAGVRVSALNTVAITYSNDTATAIIPPVETYTIGSFPNAAAAAGSSTAYNTAFGGNDHGAMVALGLVAGP